MHTGYQVGCTVTLQKPTLVLKFSNFQTKKSQTMKKVLSMLALACAVNFSVNAQDDDTQWFSNNDQTGAQQNPLNLGRWAGGTAVPQYKFFTTDNVPQPLTIQSTRWSGGLIISRAAPVASVPSGIARMVNISGWDGFGTAFEIYNSSDVSQVRFATNGSDNYISTGNLAIGTTNAQGYKLAVNGSAIFTSAKVKLFANWPDYVFDYSYSLRPLSEVEQYIRQHHHLPEVPSADEVKENGIDLGANQAILLKKIEELTLYVIAQQKEIEALKVALKKVK